jgi:aldose 1-epimerase
MSITKQDFGRMPDGQQVELYTLTNARGMRASISTFGGALVSLIVPGPQGPVDVVLGYSDLDGYVNNSGHLGALIGRYANRIAHASFELDGVRYHLPKNNGDNCLHGGPHGFDRVVWHVGSYSLDPYNNSLELTYLSQDGDAGFPGNLTATAFYALDDANQLSIAYRAVTDKDTVVNLTNHSYFNLAGAGNGDILDHEVAIYADHFTPTDAAAIPTGELRPVDGTPFDFRQPRRVGSRIDDLDEQLKIGAGYDHNFVLNSTHGKLAMAAAVREPKSGLVMNVLTTEPGMQFYTANHLRAGLAGKGGKSYGPRTALCFETQHFPDSPNQPAFPTTVLRTGEVYKSLTVFEFK